MKRRQGWLIVLAVALLLVAACGSEMARSTLRSQIPDTDLTSEEQETAPPAFDKDSPTLHAEPVERPTSVEDGHVLGSPGAPVTIVEYSDFQ